MRKVFLIIAVFLFIFLSISASAEKVEIISLEEAKKTMLETNSSLKQINFSLTQARENYDKAVEDAQDVPLEAIKRRLAQFNIDLDTYIEIMMNKQRYYVPKLMENYVYITNANRVITENSLETGLRGLYQALLAAAWDYEIKDRKLKLEKTKYKQQKDKFNKGLISGIKLEEADYNLTQANAALNKAQRNKQNATRSFNSFIGAEMGKNYDRVIFKETLAGGDLKPIDIYVGNALKNRYEIINLENDINLKQMDMDIINPGISIPDLKREYESSERSIKTSKPELEKRKYEIETEIKNAYVDVTKEVTNLKNLEMAINNQKRQLAKLKLLESAGYSSSTAITEIQIAIDELTNNYNLVMFTYNTKLMNLNNAAGYGPAYK